VKALLVFVVLSGAYEVARADVFAFKDLAGYEKCMTLDRLVETITTDKGTQTRLLTQAEIQPRCIASAVKLVTGTKNKDLMLELLAATRRWMLPESSLDLASVLVDTAIAACNDLAVYEVIISGLSHPKDDTIYVPRTRNLVKRCLKDAAFKKDFVDEKDHTDRNVSTNACQILVEEKLVKSCKGSK
jgi:hypothetical protein